MISKAANVEAYMAEVPAERRDVMARLRRLCKEHLAGYEEGMEYGMPVYRRNGVVEVSIASQKQYVALYALKKDVLDEFRDRLGTSNIGKGCVRWAKPERIDFDVVGELLTKTAQSGAGPC